MSSIDRPLIMVSNAEPYAHRWNEEGEIEMEKLAGGLTSAMDPLMQDVGGVWVAWGREDADFEVLDSDGKVSVPEDQYELKRLELSEDEVKGFYLGFSNEVLWPISHSFLGRATLDEFRDCEENWKVYREVNRKYAEAVLEEYDGNELIWVHDYHLSLVPEMVREEYPDADIAYFWHIPWPPWEVFGSLPWRGEVMDGLLSSDFIGFHNSHFTNNFFTCAEKLGYADNREENIIIGPNGGRTKVSPIPLGVDYEWFNSLSNKPDLKRRARELRKKFPAEKIVLGIDRLDYTKGIPERLRAFEVFLEEYPEFRGKVTLVQRIPPSRSSVSEYQSILNQINRIIGEINGRFEKADWSPIKSFHRFLPDQEQLIPYYMIADVALVTPLADGMNLVCKEFVSSVDDGVLILSEFAGAWRELEEAIHVNPYDAKGVADAIEKALTMPEEERKRRLSKLVEQVRENDLTAWRENFMEEWLGTVD